jgi:hypothetical protein
LEPNVRNYDDAQSPLIRSLRAAQDRAQAQTATPSGSWQSLRRAGSPDELANKARNYIHSLLSQDRSR